MIEGLLWWVLVLVAVSSALRVIRIFTPQRTLIGELGQRIGGTFSLLFCIVVVGLIVGILK